jgi:uncharacterized membrane protein
MTDAAVARRPLVLAIVLIVTGAVGWYAAFRLILDDILVNATPGATLDCNISVIVQCGKNLASWQGSLLGFPNPLLGLGGFVAPIAVGVALLAGATFARWFWIAFNAGVAAAFLFCLWLAYQSIFMLGTLCPWCMLVWSVTIPMFWTLTLRNVRSGVFGSGATGWGTRLYTWVPAITIATYLVIAIAAQVRLDVLSTLFI